MTGNSLLIGLIAVLAFLGTLAGAAAGELNDAAKAGDVEAVRALLAGGAEVGRPAPEVLGGEGRIARTANVERARGARRAGGQARVHLDGKLVRLPMPPLTTERRQELTRVAHRMSEEGRVSMRGVRRDGFI